MHSVSTDRRLQPTQSKEDIVVNKGAALRKKHLTPIQPWLITIDGSKRSDEQLASGMVADLER